MEETKKDYLVPSFVEMSFDGMLEISFNVERINNSFGKLLYDLKAAEYNKKTQKRSLKKKDNTDSD